MHSGGEGIQNLSNVKQLTRSKKLDFIKAKPSGADFLIAKAKETFIYVQKAFTKVPIFYHFDTKHHICIKTDAWEYTINRLLS